MSFAHQCRNQIEKGGLDLSKILTSKKKKGGYVGGAKPPSPHGSDAYDTSLFLLASICHATAMSTVLCLFLTSENPF